MHLPKSSSFPKAKIREPTPSITLIYETTLQLKNVYLRSPKKIVSMQFVSSVSIDGPVLHKIQKMLGEFVKVIFWSKLIRVRTDKTQCTLVGVYIGCVYILCTLCVHWLVCNASTTHT